MVQLYKSEKGLVHLIQSNYICNPELGKIKSNMNGTRHDITCKNCIQRLN